MTFDVVLRPLALSFCAALGAAALLPATVPATAQSYGAPRYGEPSNSGATPRRALDNSYRRPALAPLPAHRGYPRPGIWQGVYVGGHGGYLAGDATPSQGFDSVDFAGGALGLHVGYNWQGGNWVVGLEGDGTWANGRGSRTFAGPTLVDARADWTLQPQAAGWIFLQQCSDLCHRRRRIRRVRPRRRYRRHFFTHRRNCFWICGGGGVEMKFTPNMSGRIEACIMVSTTRVSISRAARSRRFGRDDRARRPYISFQLRSSGCARRGSGEAAQHTDYSEFLLIRSVCCALHIHFSPVTSCEPAATILPHEGRGTGHDPAAR